MNTAEYWPMDGHLFLDVPREPSVAHEMLPALLLFFEQIRRGNRPQLRDQYGNTVLYYDGAELQGQPFLIARFAAVSQVIPDIYSGIVAQARQMAGE